MGESDAASLSRAGQLTVLPAGGRFPQHVVLDPRVQLMGRPAMSAKDGYGCQCSIY